MVRNDQLASIIKQITSENNLVHERKLIQELMAEEGIQLLDCAAALLFLKNVEKRSQFKKDRPQRQQENHPVVKSAPNPIMIRYRIEIGKKHAVSVDEIKEVLVEESGVDKRLISSVEIHNQYTLLDLPEGMPDDIYQHLRSVEIRQNKLFIKRLGFTQHNRKKGIFRRNKFKNNQATDTPVAQ